MVYHTVTISDAGNGYEVSAISNNSVLFELVDSVALGGGNAILTVEGLTQLQAAKKAFEIEIVDFEEEYGYTEAQIRFVYQ